jgi:DNA-binding GntR family transcriptional regulator
VIGRVVLREQVKDLILERILRGEYEPGERIVETRVADELGISQAPVREALRDLELLRFVESEPFRGARVREVTVEELTEIYPVRAALEEVAAQAAATRLTAGDLERLETELQAMHDAADRGDLHAQAEHDAAFHRVIVEASDNTILVEVWRSLGVESRTLITALKVGADGHELAEMHRPLIEALRSRNPRRSGAALRNHLLYFSKLLKGANR